MKDKTSIRFFLDFDGTITTNDVVDLLLERHAGPLWREAEREWAEGKIGSRECLSRQIALVRASEADLETLVREVRVDPGFVSFVKKAKTLAVPVSVVSDGFDFIIRRTLKQAGVSETLPVYSNVLSFQGGRVTAEFPQGESCDHGCANCKRRVLEDARGPNELLVFVGDGLSDRYAAEISDLTFAKGKLLKFCRDRGLRHLPYESFSEIEAWLTGNGRKELLKAKTVSST